jgi:SAM-dependent methyltransferase
VDVRDETSQWYEQYYRARGRDRNDLLSNPEVLYQVLATQAATIEVLRRARLERQSARILDVGCGEGASLALLLQLGFSPNGLSGIDILGERIEHAKIRYPSVSFLQADAARMPFDAGQFDLVMESTMFVQLTDEELSHQIASEMLRVSRRYLLLIDWRYGKRGYRAVTPERIHRLFPGTVIVHERPGALIPPLGRRLSRFCPAFYLPLRSLFPFLAGVRVTLLQKS